jgi:tripartite-type tricarboxylate transporter receptor subunit TctC
MPTSTKQHDALKDRGTTLTRIVGMLAVHPSMPVRTTKEFIALAKARPGEILYGSAGIGAFQHLSMSVFANRNGLKMNHVPYKGGATAVVALMGGEVKSHRVGHLPPVRPAESQCRRISEPPHRRSLIVKPKDFEFTTWIALCGGTPRPIVDKQFKKRWQIGCRLQAFGPNGRADAYDPAEFAKQLKFDYDRLKEVVKLSGARIE